MSWRTFLGNKMVREELTHTHAHTVEYIHIHCTGVGGWGVWCILMRICMTEQLCTLDRFTQKAQLGKPSTFPISPQPGNNSSPAKYRTTAFVPHPSFSLCPTSVLRTKHTLVSLTLYAILPHSPYFSLKSLIFLATEDR